MSQILWNRTTSFSPKCVDVMDLFIKNPTIFFTPKTAALTLESSYHHVKTCMNILFHGNYLSKDNGNTYSITLANMRLWAIRFKIHVESLR